MRYRRHSAGVIVDRGTRRPACGTLTASAKSPSAQERRGWLADRRRRAAEAVKAAAAQIKVACATATAAQLEVDTTLLGGTRQTMRELLERPPVEDTPAGTDVREEALRQNARATDAARELAVTVATASGTTQYGLQPHTCWWTASLWRRRRRQGLEPGGRPVRYHWGASRPASSRCRPSRSRQARAQRGRSGVASVGEQGTRRGLTALPEACSATGVPIARRRPSSTRHTLRAWRRAK